MRRVAECLVEYHSENVARSARGGASEYPFQQRTARIHIRHDKIYQLGSREYDCQYNYSGGGEFVYAAENAFRALITSFTTGSEGKRIYGRIVCVDFPETS